MSSIPQGSEHIFYEPPGGASDRPASLTDRLFAAQESLSCAMKKAMFVNGVIRGIGGYCIHSPWWTLGVVPKSLIAQRVCAIALAVPIAVQSLYWLGAAVYSVNGEEEILSAIFNVSHCVSFFGMEMAVMYGFSVPPYVFGVCLVITLAQSYFTYTRSEPFRQEWKGIPKSGYVPLRQLQFLRDAIVEKAEQPSGKPWYQFMSNLGLVGTRAKWEQVKPVLGNVPKPRQAESDEYRFLAKRFLKLVDTNLKIKRIQQVATFAFATLGTAAFIASFVVAGDMAGRLVSQANSCVNVVGGLADAASRFSWTKFRLDSTLEGSPEDPLEFSKCYFQYYFE